MVFFCYFAMFRVSYTLAHTRRPLTIVARALPRPVALARLARRRRALAPCSPSSCACACSPSLRARACSPSLRARPLPSAVARAPCPPPLSLTFSRPFSLPLLVGAFPSPHGAFPPPRSPPSPSSSSSSFASFAPPPPSPPTLSASSSSSSSLLSYLLFFPLLPSSTSFPPACAAAGCWLLVTITCPRSYILPSLRPFTLLHLSSLPIFPPPFHLFLRLSPLLICCSW
ncbi:unnamed protein product [Closterium sp. Naga37s-1]|nr:unnamed protein product [Closterium sp. Naga37s-1]